MQKRYHGVDFARAILMMAGIFYHSALIYSPGASWAVAAPETNELYRYFAKFSSLFRMHAFYIISGFFAALLFSKRGASAAARDRIIRLGVPTLFIGFTINFIPNYIANQQQWPADWLSYLLHGEWLRHLWFLGNLIIYCLCYFLLANKFERLQANGKGNLLLTILLVITPFATTLFKDQAWRITGFSAYLFVTPRSLLLFAPYFVIGIFIYYVRDKFFQLASFRMVMLLAVVPIIVLLAAQLGTLSNDLIAMYAIELSSLLLSFAAIFLLSKIGEKGGVLIRNLSDASYSIYLLHSPLIIALYFGLFRHVEFSIHIQYACICICVFGLSFALHQYLIRKSPKLVFLINGKY